MGNLKAHFLLLEYCSEGDIDRSMHHLEDAQKMDAVTQIAMGIHQLHRKNISHNDVYPKNIFANREGDRVVYKLGDLGCAEKNGNLKNDVFQLCMLIQKMFDEKQVASINKIVFAEIANHQDHPGLNEFFFNWCRTNQELEGLPSDLRHVLEDHKLVPSIKDVVDRLKIAKNLVKRRRLQTRLLRVRC